MRQLTSRQVQICCNLYYGLPKVSWPLRPGAEIEKALRHHGLIGDHEYVAGIEGDTLNIEVAHGYIHGHGHMDVLSPKIKWYKKVILHLIDWCTR